MITKDILKLYQKAIKFACYKHLKKKQKVTGTKLPYGVHLSNVARELFIANKNTNNFNLGFALQVALLHDTIEGTPTSYDEIRTILGKKWQMLFWHYLKTKISSKHNKHRLA